MLAPRGRVIVIAARDEASQLPVRRLDTRDCSVIGFAISNATVARLTSAAHGMNQLLLREVPNILRRDLYAVPALLG